MIDDFHVHLRQGKMMEFVAPMLRKSGVRLAYPPITTTDMALSYQKDLEKVAPQTQFLMTLYLTRDLTPAEIQKASKAGIKGVKSYPRGVTTNSQDGIEDYDVYYDVFRAMEQEGMVLNLHGECPSDHSKVSDYVINYEGICVLNAEQRFLSHLRKLHRDFPRLRIVLEHATTKEAVDTVLELGPTVACTITIHHLAIVIDDWAGNIHNYCKPVAKYPHDREALQNAVLSGNPKFFLGTDSAPHSQSKKESAHPSAGVFTGAYTLQYLAHVLDSFGALDRLENFACVFGRQFYGLPLEKQEPSAILRKGSFHVPKALSFKDSDGSNETIVPFMAGETLSYELLQ